MKLEQIEEGFVCIGLTLLIILVFVAAVLKWFGIDMSWSIDAAQLVFAWACFIGSDLAMRKNRHMGVDLLTSRLSLKKQNFINLINSILIFIFLCFVIYFGVNLVITNSARSFNTLPISYSWVTASVPTGAFLMAITVFSKIKQSIKNIKNNDFSSLEKKGDEELV